jgi:hypothetical protein
MFQTYEHLTGQDIDSEMLRVYGNDIKDTTQEGAAARTPAVQ